MIIPLPTTLPYDTLVAALRERAPWFYPFTFTNGAQTAYDDPAVTAIHETRAAAIFPHLDRLYGHRWPETDVLDIACHEGWFTLQTAMRGARSVRGVDVRPDHIAQAEWVREVAGLTNVSFVVSDLYDLDPAMLGTFPLVFFIGVFYHLEDPMRALRVARSLTREVCVLEGQVARPQVLIAGQGPVGREHIGPGVAVFTGEPTHAHRPSGIVMVPTLDALGLMLMHAGFREAHLVLPALDAYEAMRTMDRAILFAYV